jgi:uncharacterized protein YaaN involved in tellurite resistance
MSKAMGAGLKAIATPPADASRVAAIRNSVNLRDSEALAAFGERARLEVAASVQRILAEVRSAEAVEAAELLRRAAALIDAKDPARLEVRGLARLFVSRRQRLEAFRTQFKDAAGLVESAAGDLVERAERLSRRATSLDRLHGQAKTFILELDAYLDAGRLTQNAAHDASGSARDLIEARLRALNVARSCAIEQLSLVRMIQNVDAPLADSLMAAARSARRWTEDWTDLLGLSRERRGKRIRPDLVTLFETKAQALEGLVGPIAALAEARRRRLDAENQMEQAAKALGAPRKPPAESASGRRTHAPA